jgi:hypothetical protein
MQRLFSMFPKGVPGFALLLLRVGLGLMFLDGSLPSPAMSDDLWMTAAGVGVAVALAIGLLTPVACTLAAVLESGVWALAGLFPVQPHVCVLLDVLALTMLGPGGYSVDARLFGRSKLIYSSDGLSEG